MDAKLFALRPWESRFVLPEQFNMVHLLLERHLESHNRERTAILFQDEEITYQQLGHMTNKIGQGLIDLGVKPGDRVIILLHDRPEFIALFLATMKIGSVPVPINILATPKDIEYFVTDSQAAIVVMENNIYPKLDTVLANAPQMKAVVISGPSIEGTTNLSRLMEESSPCLEVFPTSKNDPSYWLYTSGTTGRPKGVIHLHQDLVYAVETWGQHVVDFHPNDRVLCISKLFFSYGLNFALYLPLYYGATVILTPKRPTPETILELIEGHHPTGLFSVPTAYSQTLNYLEEKGDHPDLSCLRFCISAGEALPASIFDRWRSLFGLEILNGLGSSETGYIYISNRPGKIRKNASGKPLPGYAIQIRDEDRKVLPSHQVGELWVQSNTLFHSYWNQPEKSAQTLVNGWMRTGDMGFLDADGYFYYTARSNDTMKVSGIWVSPLEVENCLLCHSSVAECAVVGVEDDMGLTKPKAFVALKRGYKPSAELASILKHHVKQNLAPYKYPRTIEFVSDLPKTATGKIQRYKLRQSSPPS